MKRFGLLLLPFTLLAASCSTSSRDATRAGQPPCCPLTTEASTAFTDKSLYQLDSTWTNANGQSLKLGQLQGRVQVVAMFFASCTYACPILLHDMKRIESALPGSVRGGVGFTLVTIDPARDTSEALRAYQAAHQLRGDSWTLLHGNSDDTLELAALLGVKFKREASGQFAHSNLITILNDQGEIIHQIAGLKQDVSETVKRITAVAAK